MNLERLQAGLRAAARRRCVELGVSAGWIPPAEAERTADLEDPAALEVLVERNVITPRQQATLHRWQRDLDRAVLIAARLPAATPPEVRERLFTPGALLGRYVLVAETGKGGMAVVHRAWDTELGRWVALKVLRASEDPRALDRFIRAARAVAAVEDPGIVPVFDAGRVDDVHYIAMRYIEGGPLHRRRPQPREAARWIRDAARAVHACHLKGIVHRDLKPANIFLEEATGRVYVGDFGLARPREADTSISRSGTVVGTPHYMSPEQAGGRTDELDIRSDVYSLGATLYELLTGRPPFEARPGESLMQLLRRVAEQEPPPPGRFNPAIPRDLRTIVLKAMERDPSRRYQTARELAEDLQRYLDGDPILAHPASLSYRLRKKAAKHLGIVLSAVAAIHLGIAFGAYMIGSRVAVERRKREALQLAVQAERTGRLEEALGAYERAVALDPEDAEAREAARSVAEKLRARHRRLQVEIFLEKARRDLHMLRLRSYQPFWKLAREERTRFENLLQSVQERIRGEPEPADALWIMGRIHHILGRRDKAASAYDRGLKIRPDHLPCLLDRARLLIEQAMFDRFTISEVPRPRRFQNLVRQALSFLERAVRKGGEDRIELDLARGYEFVARGRAADEFCTEMLEKWKGKDFSEEFHLVRGLSRYSRGGDGATLIREATEAIRARPGFVLARFWRAVAMKMRGQRRGDPEATRAAFEELTRILEIHPNFAWAYYVRANIHRMRRDHSSAIADLTRAIEIDDRFAAAFFNRGNLRRLEGDLEGALSDYTRAIGIDPEYPDPLYNRGGIRWISGNLEAALEDFTRVTKLAPTFPRAHRSRGAILLRMGRLVESFQALSRAIELDPEDYEAYRWRAECLLALAEREPGRMAALREQARKDCRRALDAAPPDWEHRPRVQTLLKKIGPARD